MTGAAGATGATDVAFGEARTVSVHGATLAYREIGAGEPVVFVHGAISDLRTWDRQLPEIGRSYRAIAYSRRYARPNAPIQTGADDPWSRHVEDLVAFLHEVGATPAHLVGNSQGAFVSLLAAIQAPDVVRSLVLEEPPVLPLLGLSVPPRPAELLRLFATSPRMALTSLLFAARTVAPIQRAFRRGDDEQAMQIFGRGILGAGPFERLPEARHRQIRENLGPLRAVMLGSGLPELREEDVKRVQASTLLVTGAESPRVLEQLVLRLAELLPSVERVVIPDASHFMHEENAPALNEVLLRFLARQVAGSGSDRRAEADETTRSPA